jgi:DNA-binding transcriptional LysR family regulator
MLDRPVNLIDEGIDIALRISHLADSTLVATKIGEVRRVVVASPRYLAQNARIEQPADLAKHQIVAMTHFGQDSWTFPALPGATAARTVQFTPRFMTNSIRAAVASAVEGRGVTRLFSYHVASEVEKGELQLVLEREEHEPLPIHVIAPHGRMSVPKVRAFVDHGVPRLRAAFSRFSGAVGPRVLEAQSAEA